MHMAVSGAEHVQATDWGKSVTQPPLPACYTATAMPHP